MEIRIQRLSPLARLPRRGSDGAAAYDLSAATDHPVIISPGANALFPTGLAVELPKGHAALIFSRSGQGILHQVSLSNSVGVIDSDYRGEIKIGLINHGDEPYTVLPGDRVAQMLIINVPELTFVDSPILSTTDRAQSGFGSTGNR